jgi:hypothetical protein
MTHPLNYDYARPLFMLPQQRLSIDDAPQAIEAAYATGKPVLIYLHGRAKGLGEPRKSVKEKIYDNLSRYGVCTIGFTWDADDGGYDETRPVASADDFHRFLAILRKYLQSHPGAAKPSLLAHSMGNIIISELAKDDLLVADPGTLFENIVFSAAAVKQKRHKRWLEKTGVAERNYVMINPNDTMLKIAGFGFKPDMLGRDLRSPGVAPAQATYVSLERLGVKHRYFVKPGQNKQANLDSFYAQALTGVALDLASLADPDTIDGVSVMSIRPLSGVG